MFDGIVCLVKLEPFEKRVVLPHEETLKKAKEDRFNLMKSTFCNFSSIYSLYLDDERKIPTLLAGYTAAPPAQVFTDDEGVTHRLWKITDRADSTISPPCWRKSSFSSPTATIATRRRCAFPNMSARPASKTARPTM